MRLSDFMINCKDADSFASVDKHLGPTLDYVMNHVGTQDFAELTNAFLRITSIWSTMEEKNPEPQARYFLLSIMTCLVVDALQSNAETVQLLMKAPPPLIPDQGESLSTSEST